MVLVTEIVAILADKVGSSMLLRTLFVEWFLMKNSGVNNNLGDILELDHLLWKAVRLNFNEILNSCNAIDQESKKLIGNPERNKTIQLNSFFVFSCHVL